jgi:hypothetical protein
MVRYGFASKMMVSRSFQLETDMHTYLSIPNRRQPSRLVVFKRSSIWKNGTGDSVSDAGGPPGIEPTTFSTVQGSLAIAAVTIPGAGADLANNQQYPPIGLPGAPLVAVVVLILNFSSLERERSK